MKFQKIQFNRPVKIIQLFRNINIYGKELKSFDLRKEQVVWKTIQSKSGYIKENELYLPEQILKKPDFKDCDLIVLIDNNSSLTKTPEYNYCFHFTRPNKMDIFQLRKEGDRIELHLQYDQFEIGIPERDNHLLGTISRNKPLDIRINGKTDFSMSSGRERVFKEQEYIIEYIGDYSQCKVLKEPYDVVIKQLPADRKVIDLIKRLW